METFHLPTSDISLTDISINNFHEILSERKSQFRNILVDDFKLPVMVRKQSCYHGCYISLLFQVSKTFDMLLFIYLHTYLHIFLNWNSNLLAPKQVLNFVQWVHSLNSSCR